MARQWWIARQGQQSGPMARDQVLALVQSGGLSPQDHVIQEGMPAWVTVAESGLITDRRRAGAADAALAPRGQRLLAVILDGLLAALAVVPGTVAAALTAAAAPGTVLPTGLNVIGTVMVVALWLALIVLQCVLLTKTGQTIGKRIAKVRVVRAEDGGPAGFARAVGIRFLLNTLFGMWSIYPLVDALFIFSERRECLHDRIARTKVVLA